MSNNKLLFGGGAPAIRLSTSAMVSVVGSGAAETPAVAPLLNGITAARLPPWKPAVPSP